MNAATLTPSRIARRMAGELWPDVQPQRKLAPGVFDFSCAGHGGIVAVLDAAELPAELVGLARKHGKMEFVGYYGGRLITSERYTRETFERLQESGRQVWKCWVGEEDCDWALIALASEAVCVALAEKWRGRDGAAGVRDYAVDNARRWNPDYIADVAELYNVDLAELAPLAVAS